jgi:hypothetical protein
VWAGHTTGDVVACDHSGNIVRQWKLPSGVDALSADDSWRYAGCHDGKVYDLSGRTPRVAYEVKSNARIHWIDVFQGNLVTSAGDGSISAFDADGVLQFRHAPRGAGGGWMARADRSGCYLGNSVGVTKVNWKGKKLWSTPTSAIGFGWQEADCVYAFEGIDGAAPAAVVAFDKASGDVVARGSCVSKESYYVRSRNAAACAAGRGGDIIFGGTCEALFAFSKDGKKLWECPTTKIGATCSMAYHRNVKGEEFLFVVTQKGILACLDVGDAAIEKARSKAGAQATARALPKTTETSRAISDTKDSSQGVVVACVKAGGKLRVHVVSAGYDGTWFCQFPQDIREEGARYVVDDVREATQGGFYRVLGEIKRLR